MSELKPMRSDASRNHETIVTSAIAVLVESPRASMREIADASGTGRTTLYRHFPDRDALVAAIYQRVLDEADATTARFLDAATGDEDPVALIAELAAELAGLGDRYRFLEQHYPANPSMNPEHETEGGVRLLDYLTAAQRAGRIRPDQAADWLFAALVAVITRAAGYRFGDADARAEMVAATVTSLIAPPPDGTRQTTA